MFITDHNKTAIIENNTEISYAQLLQEISFYASLYKPGKKDMNIVVCMENRSQWFYTFLSAWKNNVVPVPVDYLSSPDEIAYIINDCTPFLVFYSDETEGNVEAALKKTRKKVKKINVDTVEEKFRNFEVDPLDVSDVDATAAIIYTSGTTGSPKGVMLSFDNFMANIESVSCPDVEFYRKDQQVMVMLPLHHVFPLAGTFLITLNLGGTAVFCPAISGEAIMDTLSKYKINIIIGVPRLFEMIGKGILAKIHKSKIATLVYSVAKLLQSKKFSQIVFKEVHQKFGSSLEHMISGGAALDKEIGMLFKTLGLSLIEGYGMSEAAPIIACPHPGKIEPGTVGFPLKATEVKIVDDEICFRGRNMMKGYYNKPEETAEVIKDGWLHTGDLGGFNKKGYLAITGRRKEIIVLPNGKNINPSEIESKIESISDSINEAGVYEKSGQLHIIIRPDDEHIKNMEILNLTEYFRSEVIERYNKSVAPYKRLAHIHLISSELPRTRLQKLKRHMLPELVENPREEKVDIELPEFDEYHMLAEYLKQEVGYEVKPNDHLEIDLGMDSLAKVSLLAFIKNRFGIDMQETLLSQHGRIKKLAEFLNLHRDEKSSTEENGTDWETILNQSSESITLTKSRFPHLLIKHLLSFYIKLIARIKTRGFEKIPASPYILAPNHQSVLDWLVLATSIPDNVMKKTYIFAKEKHFKPRWRRWMADRCNIIVMDIHKDLNESIQKMAEVLKQKCNLVVFPEGTRSKDGSLGNFKKSFAILARELNVPIVPIVINGSIRVLPPSKKMLRPFKRVDVTYEYPVYPDNMNYDELSDKVKEVMEKALK